MSIWIMHSIKNTVVNTLTCVMRSYFDSNPYDLCILYMHVYTLRWTCDLEKIRVSYPNDQWVNICVICDNNETKFETKCSSLVGTEVIKTATMVQRVIDISQ